MPAHTCTYNAFWPAVSWAGKRCTSRTRRTSSPYSVDLLSITPQGRWTSKTRSLGHWATATGPNCATLALAATTTMNTGHCTPRPFGLHCSQQPHDSTPTPRGYCIWDLSFQPPEACDGSCVNEIRRSEHKPTSPYAVSEQKEKFWPVSYRVASCKVYLLDICSNSVSDQVCGGLYYSATGGQES